MRKFTLNHKITIKGELAKKGVNVPKLNSWKTSFHYWNMCFYKSYPKFLMGRTKYPK